jgi:glycerophosphoryl diester phosphodiesterase
MLHCFKPIVIAHRGSFPENRMDGFEKAVRMGCHMIECDIRLSKDIHPMVIHDKTIDRTTPNHHGYVDQLSRHELERHKIPSFSELAHWMSLPGNQELHIAIELKHLGKEHNKIMTQTVLAILESHHLIDRSIVISFNMKLIKDVKKICPNVHSAIIIPYLAYPPIRFRDPFQLCDEHDSDHLWMYHRIVTKQIVEKAKKVRKKVFAWTVNHEERIKSVCDLGVDGIITDYPEKLLLTQSTQSIQSFDF